MNTFIKNYLHTKDRIFANENMKTSDLEYKLYINEVYEMFFQSKNFSLKNEYSSIQSNNMFQIILSKLYACDFKNNVIFNF